VLRSVVFSVLPTVFEVALVTGVLVIFYYLCIKKGGENIFHSNKVTVQHYGFIFVVKFKMICVFTQQLIFTCNKLVKGAWNYQEATIISSESSTSKTQS